MRRADAVARVRFFVIVAFLAICLLGGGSSQPSALSHIYVFPSAVLCMGFLAVTPGTWDWRPLRPLVILLAVFAFVMCLQIVPLPPELWTQLPGREKATGTAEVLGMAQPWRSLSLTPDATVSSLLCLIVPAAVLTGFASLQEKQRTDLVPVLLIGMLASLILGLLQAIGGRASPAYTYAIHSDSAAVGLFANRNHQALFLAMALPLLAAWEPRRGVLANVNKRWIILGATLLLIPSVLVTGSRTGILLVVLGLVSALLLSARRARGARAAAGRSRLVTGALIAGAIGVGLATLLAGRALSLDRLIGFDAESEQRFNSAPLLIQMLSDLFVTGTGFGSFDPVYRSYETDPLLHLTFFNHAHNDFVELALTGGIPALAVLAGFIGWWILRTHRQLRARTRLPVAASSAILMVGVASLVDYPLRTSLVAAVFTLSCCWLACPTAAVRGQSEGYSS